MKSPWVPFDYYLAGGIGGQLAFIAEPNWLSSGSQTNPIGTGPFVFQSWTPNDHFTATKNPHYWRSGLPYLDSVTYKPIPDSQQLLASLMSGSVDIIHTSTSQVTKSLRADTSLGYIDDSVKVAGEPDMGCVLLNLSEAPFDQQKFRQAAAMAIDSAQYVAIIDSGVNPTSNGPFVQGSAYYLADNGYPSYDPTKAKQLVQEVQQAGHSVTFTLNHVPDPNTTKIAEYLQQQFKNVGMQVSISPIEQAQIINTALHRQVPGPGVAAVRGHQPGPQLHLLESDTDQLGVLHQHGPQHRPDDGDRAPPGTPVHAAVGQSRRLPAGEQADGLRHPLHLDRPRGVVDRGPAPGGELQQPHHARRPAGVRLHHRRGVVHPDLAEFLTPAAARAVCGRPWDDRLMSRILIVEDDERIRSSMRLALEDEGYAVDEAGSGEEAVDQVAADSMDLVLLDLMLPGMDGFETCRSLRRHSAVPVIMVTARTDTHDVVAGLEAGADDYVTKPFVAKELAARIRALLRRSRSDTGTPSLGFGDVQIEPDAGVVRRDGEEVHCTRTEFRLLCELADHPGKVLSREHLLERVWGYDYFGDGRLVDVHVRRLRTKVEPDPANPRFILTVRGMGYKLAV